MNTVCKNKQISAISVKSAKCSFNRVSGNFSTMLKSVALLCATVLAMFFFLVKPAASQGLGSINGTVTDSTGAIIPGADVTATQASTGIAQKTTTNAAGFFVFPSLAPSTYNLTVTYAGFAAYLEKGLQLRADAAVTSNVILKAGAAEQTVTVSAQAAQVDTTTGTLAQVIGTAQVNQLPLNGRNAAQLTELVAGVAAAPATAADQGSTKSFPSVVAVTINGTRVGQTNYLLDGGNNVDEYTNVNDPFPMPDALQEFSVQTSNYNAEYGQNAGGVVNIITKSGTSQYHGNIFEFVRNRVFNAANYFSYSNNVKTVDPLKRNQFGGTFGGPVKIPYLYHGNKAFFFVGYQKTINRDVSPAATAATLPTPAQLDGTFANESACIVNPLQPSHVYPCTQTGTTPAGKPIYSSTVNPADYSSASQKLLTYLPLSQENANGTYAFLTPNDFNYQEFEARYDQELGAKDRLVVRYFQDSYHLDGVLNLTDLLTYADQADIKYYNSLISESHTFSDRILNNIILSYQIENSARGPLPGGIDVGDLGVNIFQPAFKQINSIATTGYFTIGGNPQAFFQRANYTLADDVHVELGQHNIAFGFHGETSKIDINNLYRQPGTFTFNANNVNDPIASFLFGYVYEFQQASGQFFNGRNNFYGTYLQDSWKINRRFTANYGLRYEPFTPWRESQGRMGSFFPALWAAGTHSVIYPLAPAGLLFAGDKGFNPNGIDVELKHFMPRLGFAWDVFGTGKTSVRGGAGLFFDSRINSTLFNIYTNSSPFITNVDVTNAGGQNITFTDPYGSYGTPNPFPAPQPPPATSPIPPQPFLTYDPFRGFQDPRTVSYNLTVEQQLNPGLSMRLAYVGEESRHQTNSVEINPFINGVRIYNQPGCTLNNSCYTQPITEANTGGNTNYNSLQISVEQRLHRGLTVLGNYTWSKALDNMVLNNGATSIGAGSSYVYPINVPNFKKLDYGPSDFDHRNVASISYVYDIPHVLGESPAALRYVVNGWETTGLFAYTSGDPLTIVSSSANNSGSGQQRDRAVLIGKPYGGTACSPTAHCKNYLNPASFTNNPVGTYGTVAKGSFVGPQYADWDVSLARHFHIYERLDLQFRAEYFNILNHTNFGDPNSTATNSNFGQITSTAPQNSDVTNNPRIAQLSLKLLF